MEELVLAKPKLLLDVCKVLVAKWAAVHLGRALDLGSEANRGAELDDGGAVCHLRTSAVSMLAHVARVGSNRFGNLNGVEKRCGVGCWQA